MTYKKLYCPFTKCTKTDCPLRIKPEDGTAIAHEPSCYVKEGKNADH